MAEKPTVGKIEFGLPGKTGPPEGWKPPELSEEETQAEIKRLGDEITGRRSLEQDHRRLKDKIGCLIEFFHRGGRSFLTNGRGSPKEVRRLQEYLDELEKMVDG